MEGLWFQDTRTGCEKQAHYFVQIRKLQDELIQREQHNLIHAMERLKQLSYPRKRQMVRNAGGSDFTSTQHFPARSLNLRKEAKFRAQLTKEKPDLSPISGQPLMRNSGNKKEEQIYDNFLVMPRLLNDKDIARIINHANEISPSEPSRYLLRPQLPSIPNVGRKTNLSVDNRLRLLTLAEYEFPEPGEGIRAVSGRTKYLHSCKSNNRERTPARNSSRLGASKENLNKRSQSNVLTFDVDPNDPSLFSHCVGDKKQEEQHDSTPSPPPNSRPSTKASNFTPEVNLRDDSVLKTTKELPAIVVLDAEKKLDPEDNSIVPATNETSDSIKCKEDLRIHVSIPVEQVMESQSP